ncbi:MAG: hypothetical protein Q9181_007440 [Wetmoreana brouardii]
MGFARLRQKFTHVKESLAKKAPETGDQRTEQLQSFQSSSPTNTQSSPSPVQHGARKLQRPAPRHQQPASIPTYLCPFPTTTWDHDSSAAVPTSDDGPSRASNSNLAILAAMAGPPDAGTTL